MQPSGAVLGADPRMPGWMGRLESQGLADSSIEKYTRDLAQFITYCRYKRVAVEEADWSFLEEWIRHLRAAGRAPMSINGKLQAVGSFYDYLLRLGKIQHNPRKDVRSLKNPKKVPQYLSEEATGDLLSKVKERLDLAMLETLYGCGLRNSEVCSVNTRDVLWDEAIFRVMGKGSKERLVPIPITCLQALKAWLPERERRIARWPQRDTGGALFVNTLGRRYTPFSVRTVLRRVALQLGIKGRFYPHLFRHSYATHMYNAGADIRALQELLGHGHLQTTEIYTHVGYKKLSQTVRQFHPRSGGVPPCQTAS